MYFNCELTKKIVKFDDCVNCPFWDDCVQKDYYREYDGLGIVFSIVLLTILITYLMVF